MPQSLRTNKVTTITSFRQDKERLDKLSLPDLVSIGTAPGKLKALSSDRTTLGTRKSSYDFKRVHFTQSIVNELGIQTSFKDLESE